MAEPAAAFPVVLPIRLIHSVNSKICTCLGSALNLLLVWLVAKRTPPELKVYSAIILQTCICDLILLALAEFVQWIPFMQSGTSIAVENGLASVLPHPWNVVFVDLWVYMSYSGIAGICVQFIYRYQVLYKLRDYTLRQYFRLLLAAALSQLLVLAPFYWAAYPGGEHFVSDKQLLQILNTAIDAQPNWDLREVVVGDISDNVWVFFFVVDSVNITVCYSIIVFCAVKMTKFVRNNLRMPNKKRVAEINRQMTLNMIIQALLPLVNLFVYGSLICEVFFLQQKQQWLIYATMLFGPLLNWVPVLNPVVTIATVAPYRRALFRPGNNVVLPST